MAAHQQSFEERQSLDQICQVPDHIISVYSLEEHVWEGGVDYEVARQTRSPELKTIDEFQIDPVRPLLSDILRQLAAPYRPDRRGDAIGQGYWIQAAFGSGKSHLLCFLGALALGDERAWQRVRDKEARAGRGRRESLYYFWEEGLERKSKQEKGILVVVKTLIGHGGGAIGFGKETSRGLADYILEAVRDQVRRETGEVLALYPADLLADRFLQVDVERYRDDLGRYFASDAFADDEREEVETFLDILRSSVDPVMRNSCANKLWRFYTEYLQIQPILPTENEDVLKHMVEAVLALGYAGVLLILDEMSLFLKNRTTQRMDDEQVLTVLANRLTRTHFLPIWTICAAQERIEGQMGERNIIADDRMKLCPLLTNDEDYYAIVLARVRTISNLGAIRAYYDYYKQGFSYVDSLTIEEFTKFFPFHKSALPILRAITSYMTTARSAIYFMHHALKHQMHHKGRTIISLWELFDEAVRYEEDPSGTAAGLAPIKARFETEFHAYEACTDQINQAQRGMLKTARERSVKIIKTLFLYYIAQMRSDGLTPEEIANLVLDPKNIQAAKVETAEHYELILDEMRGVMRQIVSVPREDKSVAYRFEPVVNGIDPPREFARVMESLRGHDAILHRAWRDLLVLREWTVPTRQMRIDLLSDQTALFSQLEVTRGLFYEEATKLPMVWRGRKILGRIGLREAQQAEGTLTQIQTDQNDVDFAVYVTPDPLPERVVDSLLDANHDPRIIIWSPAEPLTEDTDRLLRYAAYRALVDEYGQKDTDDAQTMLQWMREQLRTEIGQILLMVRNRFGRGRLDARDNRRMAVEMAGDLAAILRPTIDRVLAAIYMSEYITFRPTMPFGDEEALKVMNGIVKMGSYPAGVKRDQYVEASQNFGPALGIMDPQVPNALRIVDNLAIAAIEGLIDDRLRESDTIPLAAFYKNFMGLPWGLSRRMVQLYLLCLARMGRIRIRVGGRGGANAEYIDATTIANLTFTATLLNNLIDVRRMTRPELWDVVAPFLEVLLNKPLSELNEMEISPALAAARGLFSHERPAAGDAQERCGRIFAALAEVDAAIQNPFADDLQHFAALFASSFDGERAIALILDALQRLFGYQAYNTNRADPADLDDFRVRFQRYQQLKDFAREEHRLTICAAYAAYRLPEDAEFADLRERQQGLREQLRDARRLIEVPQAREEALGTDGGPANQRHSFAALQAEYRTRYLHWHERIADAADEARAQLDALSNGAEMRALAQLDGVAALAPPLAEETRRALRQAGDALFTCADPAPAALNIALARGVEHSCHFRLANAPELLAQSAAAVAAGQARVTEALDRKLLLLLAETLVRRFAQSGDAALQVISQCESVAALRARFLPLLEREGDLPGRITRALREVVVRRVRLADFRPSRTTIEVGDIDRVVAEFHTFLRQAIHADQADGAVQTVLQMETDHE